jgi:hypothetical protein
MVEKIPCFQLAMFTIGAENKYQRGFLSVQISFSEPCAVGYFYQAKWRQGRESKIDQAGVSLPHADLAEAGENYNQEVILHFAS